MLSLICRLAPVLTVCVLVLAVSANAAERAGAASQTGRSAGAPAQPALQLVNPQAVDQDDMCVWRSPREASESLIITSDKSANYVFVYDLQGKLLQSVPVPKPGNIDIRQNVKFHRETLDVVVVNQRKGFQLVCFKVDPATRQLVRLDKEPLLTGPNYGGCLSQSRQNGGLSFLCTSQAGSVEQHQLWLNDKGEMLNRKVRDIPIGKCEGAVADDEAGVYFITEEAVGVWKVDADPESSASPVLIARVGADGLQGDLEGVALVTRGDGMKSLLVSDQGRNRYVAFSASAPYAWQGEFGIAGAEQTDGIEAVAFDLGPAFPRGIFCCHTDVAPRPVLVTPWPAVEACLQSK
ncbi:phytase [Planctomicrobium piriforme]|uniref:3-phytase n=1 Tax=Planctomicrobium piriforme TaxID=1576369 RepID=A0A1I3LQC9_9PLAN|nr:phytase [Planctomicrobium piriforme]SFI86979.1 3-phytase [Planctomicrobium piriforme]